MEEGGSLISFWGDSNLKIDQVSRTRLGEFAVDHRPKQVDANPQIFPLKRTNGICPSLHKGRESANKIRVLP